MAKTVNMSLSPQSIMAIIKSIRIKEDIFLKKVQRYIREGRAGKKKLCYAPWIRTTSGNYVFLGQSYYEVREPQYVYSMKDTSFRTIAVMTEEEYLEYVLRGEPWSTP